MTPGEAGRTARYAGVRKLVLSHLLPSADTVRVWKEASSEFTGEAVVGEDLMEVSCAP